jgi:hypothetical protein
MAKPYNRSVHSPQINTLQNDLPARKEYQTVDGKTIKKNFSHLKHLSKK